MLVRKGFVDKNLIWKFVKGYENYLENERWNNRETLSGRKCCWLGVGVELGSNNVIFKGLEIKNNVWKRMCDIWGGDDWNSILIYKYNVGVELKIHVDRDIFDSKVVVINVSEDNLLGGNIEFLYGGKVEILSNGEIIEFNSKIQHGVKKVESERWSISIRKVKI
ncbi:hypothetical protein NIES4075_67940 [Tolypothrix sp. NIES-4075]|uniref:hypothetical protein n=1 Tax=Tolypothrix sp. NIES-4075 TaxID=2005459 RepID=UPI000B5C7DDC|nr:hypothetical protein [Tolypothrix sp. NIES-4075]GAX45773.1 hypothetical protein NIES4075_67940 [Tolypothrix sp. NIES-4075]